MLSGVAVTRTRLLPPRPHRRLLVRPRLTRRLLEALDYRLTLLQAGAGYGKSTALAGLVEEGHPVVWYHLDTEDADPMTFLLHLLHGFRAVCPEAVLLPLALLEEQGGQQTWTAPVDALADGLTEHLSAPHLLVIDDAHLLNQSLETLTILDRLIGRASDCLHTILSTRYPLRLPTLVAWRARGEVLEIRQDELAFTPEEIEALFAHQYGLPLSPAEVALLAERTEGWPIALQLVWQTLHSRGASTVPEALKRIAGPTESLFPYLAQEVLRQQPPPVRDFLLTTAVLREMTPARCDHLRGTDDGARVLEYLIENGLFVVDLGEGQVRYHHLFREFLYQQLSPEEARQAHRRAARCFAERGELPEAVPHFLAAQEFEDAATLLDRIGRDLVQAGLTAGVAAQGDRVGPLRDAHLFGHEVIEGFEGSNPPFDRGRAHSLGILLVHEAVHVLDSDFRQRARVPLFKHSQIAGIMFGSRAVWKSPFQIGLKPLNPIGVRQGIHC
jgi:ATP/maltotriose-dependent transcriptional regulator MalT